MMNKETNIVEEVVEVHTDVKAETVRPTEVVPDVYIELKSLPEINVDDVATIDITMEEAFPFMSSGILDEAMDDKDVLIEGGVAIDANEEYVSLEDLLNMSAEDGNQSHALLHGRELSDQHPISAITDLDEELTEIKRIKRVYSSESGLGEFRMWDDENPQGEDRSGYFVTIVQGTENIAICDSTHDVYGVSVNSSGFVGNQNELDKSDDWDYSMVGIVGTMRVRTDGTARNGEYVVPNAFGEATKSSSDYGYKVLSQGSYPSYNYVVIAVTPQSDALSRLEDALSGSEESIGNILIELNIAKDKADSALNNSQIAIDTSMSNSDLMDVIKETADSALQKATTAQDVANTAQTSADQAKTNAQQAVSTSQQAVAEAQGIANNAVDKANSALTEVSDLKAEMKPLAQWTDGENYGVAGFVKQSNQDHTTLATLVSGFGPDGSDVSAIIQKLDENGALIQHLVSHVDRYAVGEYSLSYGLTYEEAKSILQDTYTYVPTFTHDETMEGATGSMTFEQGKSYTWNNIYYYWMEDPVPVSTNVTYKDGSAGELWYCWQDVEQLDDEGKPVTTYTAGTLYKWMDTMWVAVATTGDNYRGRVLTSVKQTADTIEMSVINSKAEGSTFQQKLDSIFTTVYNSDGYISAIEQNADRIMAGTYSPDNSSSSLELLAAGVMNAVVHGQYHTVYQSLIGTAPASYDGKKYSGPPSWDETKQQFVFNEELRNNNGIYYFSSADKTKYCKVVDTDNYEIYTVGNQATSALESRVSDTEAILNGTVDFATHNSSALGGIYAKADEAQTSISYLASYYYHSLLSASEEVVTNSGTKKYNAPPVWNQAENKYVFDEKTANANGVYYMADKDSQTYCKVVTLSDGTKLYETYGISGSSAASILQQADANSAAIGLVVDSGNIKGSALIEAINGEGSVGRISADKIVFSINATDTNNQFAMILNDHQATIQNGDLKIIDDKYQILLNPTDAFRIQKNLGTANAPNWKNQFYVQSATGDVYFAGQMIGGLIKSENFAMSGSTCTAGMQIDLNNGELVSPYFSLTAQGGKIAGWTVNQYNIYSSATGSKYVALNSDPNNIYAIWAGNQTASSAPFSVTKDGSLTAVNANISGAIQMGAGSTISWASIDETGSSAYSMASGAQTTANSAYSTATSAQTTANSAQTTANSAYSTANSANVAANEAEAIAIAIANGTYKSGTFINGTSIYSPSIYANEFTVYPDYLSSSGHFILKASDGFYNNAAVLDINYYSDGGLPVVDFSSPAGANMSINSSLSAVVFMNNLIASNSSFNQDTYFSSVSTATFDGYVDFSGARSISFYGTGSTSNPIDFRYSTIDFTGADLIGLETGGGVAVFG